MTFITQETSLQFLNNKCITCSVYHLRIICNHSWRDKQYAERSSAKFWYFSASSFQNSMFNLSLSPVGWNRCYTICFLFIKIKNRQFYGMIQKGWLNSSYHVQVSKSRNHKKTAQYRIVMNKPTYGPLKNHRDPNREATHNILHSEPSQSHSWQLSSMQLHLK